MNLNQKGGFIMEDGLVIVSKLQKLMRNNLQIIGDTMISGGVDNMEKYQVYVRTS